MSMHRFDDVRGTVVRELPASPYNDDLLRRSNRKLWAEVIRLEKEAKRLTKALAGKAQLEKEVKRLTSVVKTQKRYIQAEQGKPADTVVDASIDRHRQTIIEAATALVELTARVPLASQAPAVQIEPGTPLAEVDRKTRYCYHWQLERVCAAAVAAEGGELNRIPSGIRKYLSNLLADWKPQSDQHKRLRRQASPRIF